MKKKVLKLTFLLLTVAVIFSSCLGDTENKIEVSSDYACVVDPYGQPNAFAASVGYVFASEFQQLEKGTILAIGYKIMGTQTSSVPTLQEINIQKKFTPATQSPLRWYASEDSENEVYPTTFSVVGSGWSPYTVFLDRWLFAPYFDTEEGTKITAAFYYDPNNQDEDASGNRIENRIVLDVRFTSDNPAPVSTINKAYDIVGNFDGIRDRIQSLSNFKWGATTLSEGGTPVYVKFRYRLYSKTSSTGYEEKTLGTATGTDYQFVLTKD